VLTCAPLTAQLNGSGSVCNVTLTAPALMAAPVFMYYQVDNFFQNHRRCARACLMRAKPSDGLLLAADLLHAEQRTLASQRMPPRMAH
jgi:hypothetical protein